MREKIKELNRFQKVILILLALLTAIYAVAYTVATTRTGLVYRDEILRPLADGSGWAGKVDGTEVMISFADDGMYYTVDGATSGPYTMVKDDSALPDSVVMGNMEGIEIRCGDEIVFRGGAQDFDSYVWLESEDGKTDIGAFVQMEIENESVSRKNQKPTNSELYRMLTDPVIGRKGNWSGFVMGLFISILFAVSILFADELFRWHLSFSIRNAEHAEPSEWEMAGRYIGWTLAPILALATYAIGLGEIVM